MNSGANAVLLSLLLAVSTAMGQNVGSRVRQAVAEAKAKSLTETTIPPPSILPTGVSDFDTVANDYSVLVAEPIQVLVSAENANGIETWYKLRVEDRLLQQKDLSSNPPPELPIPSALLPLADDEFLIREPGGEVTIDGVTVKEHKPIGLSLQVGERYLLCLFFQSNGQLALLAALQDGIFSIDASGAMRPLGSSDRPLARDIERKFSNRLESVRTYLAQRPPSPAK